MSLCRVVVLAIEMICVAMVNIGNRNNSRQVARLRSRPNRFCSSGHRAKSNSLNDVGFSPSPLPKPLQRGSACCDAARQNGARIDDLSVSSL
eukprot:s611_g3.t3